MTGMEAWSVVGPILATHMHIDPSRVSEEKGNYILSALDEAYVTTFGALQMLDRLNQETAHNQQRQQHGSQQPRKEQDHDTKARKRQ